jgi:hypothetical protein
MSVCARTLKQARPVEGFVVAGLFTGEVTRARVSRVRMYGGSVLEAVLGSAGGHALFAEVG